MRILVITNLYPDRKRPAFGIFVSAHVEALRQAGADVDVAAIRRTGVHGDIGRKYALLFGSAVARGALALFRRARPQIVEAHIAYPTGVIAWPIARLMGAKLVLYVHGADVHEVGSRSRLHHRLARFVFARADLVVVNSRYSERSLLGGYAVDPRKVVVLSPGIDVRQFAAETNVSRDQRQILFVGTLNEQKGVDVLLRAMARVGTQASLRIVGDGPARDSLEAEAAALQLMVRFDGAVQPDGVARAMAACAILVVPSVYGEALGLVALEAMASGALVIASRTGGLVETVEDGVNGFLAPPGDAEALALCIERALAIVDAGGDTLDHLVTAGRKRATEHDIVGVTLKILARYSMLTGTTSMATTMNAK
ncbi:MAG TPA: glycosyltransferase [Rhodothermales bacterium]